MKRAINLHGVDPPPTEQDPPARTAHLDAFIAPTHIDFDGNVVDGLCDCEGCRELRRDQPVYRDWCTCDDCVAARSWPPAEARNHLSQIEQFAGGVRALEAERLLAQFNAQANALRQAVEQNAAQRAPRTSVGERLRAIAARIRARRQDMQHLQPPAWPVADVHRCYRCAAPHPTVEFHYTNFERRSGIISGMFPLCVTCWHDLGTGAARLPFYALQVADWQAQGVTDDEAPLDAIRRAVLAGG